jgi:hypothetical protein
MAANDNRGRQVLEACRAYELAVPDEVAVIGVDNDELLCRLSSPSEQWEQGARKLRPRCSRLAGSHDAGSKFSATAFRN